VYDGYDFLLMVYNRLFAVLCGLPNLYLQMKHLKLSIIDVFDRHNYDQRWLHFLDI